MSKLQAFARRRSANRNGRKCRMTPGAHSEGSRAVLIVEDSENSAATIELALSGIPGVSVLFAASGVEALRIMDQPGSAVQAIITDLNMPRMDGFELIRRIRENGRTSATAHHRGERRHRSRDSRADRANEGGRLFSETFFPGPGVQEIGATSQCHDALGCPSLLFSVPGFSPRADFSRNGRHPGAVRPPGAAKPGVAGGGAIAPRRTGLVTHGSRGSCAAEGHSTSGRAGHGGAKTRHSGTADRRAGAEQGGSVAEISHPAHRDGALQRVCQLESERRAASIPPSLPPPAPRTTGPPYGKPLSGWSSRAPRLFGAVMSKARSTWISFRAAAPLTQTMRLRTGSMEIDWATRSIMAGVEKPIFNPREPSSLAQVGVSPLTGAGNLWLWMPQVRFEQDFALGTQQRHTRAHGRRGNQRSRTLCGKRPGRRGGGGASGPGRAFRVLSQTG